MKHILRSVSLIVGLAILAGCVPAEDTNTFAERRTARCEQGPPSFTIVVDGPTDMQPIRGMQQYAQMEDGTLRAICPLRVGESPIRSSFNGYDAEVFDGRAGMCVAIRDGAERRISCVGADEVAVAVDSQFGSPLARLRFASWSQY